MAAEIYSAEWQEIQWHYSYGSHETQTGFNTEQFLSPGG